MIKFTVLFIRHHKIKYYVVSIVVDVLYYAFVFFSNKITKRKYLNVGIIKKKKNIVNIIYNTSHEITNYIILYTLKYFLNNENNIIPQTSTFLGNLYKP
jgi:hypothetical protein